METYQDIVRAVGTLTPQERESIVRLLGDDENRPVAAPETVEQSRHHHVALKDEDVIHAVDRDGNAQTLPIKDLIWNPDSYDYIKTQSHSFATCLPELVSKYAGYYVVFEDGRVVDRDRDEEVLLDRVCQSDFYNQRDAIYYDLVPDRLEVNA